MNRAFGTRTTLLLGTVLVSAAWLSASFATRVWHLFLTVGVLFGWVSETCLLFSPSLLLRCEGVEGHRGVAGGVCVGEVGTVEPCHAVEL